jgi:hypothetical protein
MYCIEHYPSLQSVNALVTRVQNDLSVFQSAEVEYWRAEDSKQMKESILRKYQAEEMLVSKEPYSPVSLPSLPRSACPCVTLGWTTKGEQTKQRCNSRVQANGFCAEHRLSYEFLEIGAQLDYPEVKVPFEAHISKRIQTLYRTIPAGVTSWEQRASILHTDRPRALEENVNYLRRKFALQLREMVATA